MRHTGILYKELFMKELGEQLQPPLELGAELIYQQTGFKLAMVFTGFAREDGFISPDLHEERERLSSEHGENNVLPSFFIEDNTVQLGLFIRKPKELGEFEKRGRIIEAMLNDIMPIKESMPTEVAETIDTERQMLVMRAGWARIPLTELEEIWLKGEGNTLPYIS